MITDTSKNQKKYNILKVTYILINYCILMGFSGFLEDNYVVNVGEIVLWALKIVLFLFISLIISTLIHELGHMVYGLKNGYKFLSFKLLFVKLYKNKGKLKLKWDQLPLMGQCLMTYDKPEEEMDIKNYSLGGVRFNLMFSILFLIGTIIVLIFSGKLNLFLFSLYWMNLSLYMTNRIPLNIRGIYNDGLNVKLCENLTNAKTVMLKSIKLQAQIDSQASVDDISQDILDCINLDLPDVFIHIYDIWLIETAKRLKNENENPFEFVKKFHYRRNQYPIIYQYLNVQLVLANDLLNDIDYRGLLFDKAYKRVFNKVTEKNPILMCSFDVIDYLNGKCAKDELLIRLDENREFVEKYSSSTIEKELAISLTKLMYKKAENGGFDKKEDAPKEIEVNKE